jgi:hypothetical protein
MYEVTGTKDSLAFSQIYIKVHEFFFVPRRFIADIPYQR